MMQKGIKLAVVGLFFALQIASAQSSKPLVMSKDFVVVFSEMPTLGTDFQVDFSQVEIKDEAVLRSVLEAADTKLAGFHTINFKKKTATLLLKTEIELPSKWSLENWNQYFEQMGNLMKGAVPEKTEK